MRPIKGKVCLGSGSASWHRFPVIDPGLDRWGGGGGGGGGEDTWVVRLSRLLIPVLESGCSLTGLQIK